MKAAQLASAGPLQWKAAGASAPQVVFPTMKRSLGAVDPFGPPAPIVVEFSRDSSVPWPAGRHFLD
eukprot:SAG31_NODE_168_length_21484_cov_21.524994_9_plen_66_part_00